MRTRRSLRIASKKAFVAKTVELVFCIIAYVILVVIAMFFIGMAKIRVEADLDAMNARFTCSNNLMSFLKLQASTGQPMEEFLLTSYVSYVQGNRSTGIKPPGAPGVNETNTTPSDYTENITTTNVTVQGMAQFGNESASLLNGILGAGEWGIGVADYTETVLTLGGVNVTDKTESCYVYLPVPCSEEGDCLLTVGMTVPIKK